MACFYGLIILRAGHTQGGGYIIGNSINHSIINSVQNYIISDERQSFFTKKINEDLI